MANTTFGMPSGISLPVFDGSEYSTWAGILEAILALHEADDVIFHDTVPVGGDAGDFAMISSHAKAYLRLFIKPDIYSLITSDTDYPTFKQKWDQLCNTYGGTSGSTAIFNTWIQLTQARLDKSAPMAPQLAKLNEAQFQLHSISMGVTDTQYYLILLHALPPSYEVLASTILAGSAPNTLRHTEITACITSKEAHHAGPSGSSLNAAARLLSRALAKAKARRTTQTSRATTVTRRGTSSLIAAGGRRMRRARRRKRAQAVAQRPPIVTYMYHLPPLRRSMILVLPCMLLSM